MNQTDPVDPLTSDDRELAASFGWRPQADAVPELLRVFQTALTGADSAASKALSSTPLLGVCATSPSDQPAGSVTHDTSCKPINWVSSRASARRFVSASISGTSPSTISTPRRYASSLTTIYWPPSSLRAPPERPAIPAWLPGIGPTIQAAPRAVKAFQACHPLDDLSCHIDVLHLATTRTMGVRAACRRCYRSRHSPSRCRSYPSRRQNR